MKTLTIPSVNNDKYNIIKCTKAEEKNPNMVQNKHNDTGNGQLKGSLQDTKDNFQNNNYEKQLKEMNDQLEEMKRKNLEDSIKYLTQYKNIEEHTIGGPVSAGMYNLTNAKNKITLFRALKSGHNLSKNNDENDKKTIEKIELDLLQDANNEVKKSIRIGIKEAEAARINKHRDDKHKIKKIKIYIDPEEENKFDKTINSYMNKKLNVKDGMCKATANDEEVKHVDAKI